MDKSRVDPTIFFIEKISFSLKLFSGHFYGQSFIKTVRGPLEFKYQIIVSSLKFRIRFCEVNDTPQRTIFSNCSRYNIEFQKT